MHSLLYDLVVLQALVRIGLDIASFVRGRPPVAPPAPRRRKAAR